MQEIIYAQEHGDENCIKNYGCSALVLNMAFIFQFPTKTKLILICKNTSEQKKIIEQNCKKSKLQFASASEEQ